MKRRVRWCGARRVHVRTTVAVFNGVETAAFGADALLQPKKMKGWRGVGMEASVMGRALFTGCSSLVFRGIYIKPRSTRSTASRVAFGFLKHSSRNYGEICKNTTPIRGTRGTTRQGKGAYCLKSRFFLASAFSAQVDRSMISTTQPRCGGRPYERTSIVFAPTISRFMARLTSTCALRHMNLLL